jgi:hypothetical protein
MHTVCSAPPNHWHLIYKFVGKNLISCFISFSTISYSDGVLMAKKILALHYIEVSALTGEGVNEAFEVLVYLFNITVHAD